MVAFALLRTTFALIHAPRALPLMKLREQCTDAELTSMISSHALAVARRGHNVQPIGHTRVGLG